MIEVIHNVKLILIHLVKSLKAIEIFYCQFTVIVPAWNKYENRYLVVASSSSSFCHSQVKNMVQEYIVYKFCQRQNEETKLNWLWELLMALSYVAAHWEKLVLRILHILRIRPCLWNNVCWITMSNWSYS